MSDLLDGKIAIMLKIEAGKQKEFVIFTDYNAERMDICLREMGRHVLVCFYYVTYYI